MTSPQKEDNCGIYCGGDGFTFFQVFNAKHFVNDVVIGQLNPGKNQIFQFALRPYLVICVSLFKCSSSLTLMAKILFK